jgi:guanosine-3',5'-bis(diphosphate) 3'-pyrophosphohydrolase
MQKVIKAAAFAAYKHRDQRRKDQQASPYINHPLALANVLCNEVTGIEDQDVVCAALLHDTIEDTDTSHAEIEAEFGRSVLDVVLEVTDDKTLPKAQRKLLQIEHAPSLSRSAKLVKLADKICNLRDMAASPPSDWSLDRRIEYFDWSKAVVDGMRGTDEQLERLFDQAFTFRPAAV